MQLTIFGASGKVGRLVVNTALKRGHTVVAFVHHQPKPGAFVNSDHLTIIQGDVHDAQAVAAAIQASQAIISCLGSWGTASKDIVSSGTQHIIKAVNAAANTTNQPAVRFVSLTGSEAFTDQEANSTTLARRLSHRIAQLVARQVLEDGERHIRLLQVTAAAINWTVLRSPVMTPQTNDSYRLCSQARGPWHTIPRQAVAQALIDQAEIIDNGTFFKATPCIYRR